MSNFDQNAILRGFQLTLVGAHRALQNPALFTSQHYRQAALAVAAGLVISLIIKIPVIVVHMFIWCMGFFTNLEEAGWDDSVVNGLEFVEHSVLQLPFFFMSLMSYITPTMDRMFMDSLAWVDKTYVQKHRSDEPDNLRAMYYPNLKLYAGHYEENKDVKSGKGPWDAALAFVVRSARKAGISIAIYLLTFVPLVGRFVMPAASFYTFNKAVGLQPAVIVFGSSAIVPRRWLIVFLQSYFSSRSLMRQLLEPYFSRIKFSKEQKRKWFKDREGVLFGFGVGFFIMLKIPLLGVLVYGIAEASAAYLITKITDPPPPPSQAPAFRESQIHWKNKHEFIALPLGDLDSANVDEGKAPRKSIATDMPSKSFT
ncbi:hypothetical protein BDY21DRAFT_396485 [Lineolata rhizophorae]|uniref:Transmembrane protein UsgS n=1 Tax=Lineolata rhizophorae TaxID=578093 RepID=A0A6A6NUY3_9PEZI|nr:hypothetical protein BDY21DRAFT_396485 [Lineolata rhizophorae]